MINNTTNSSSTNTNNTINNLNHDNSLNKFHTIISNVTSSPTINGASIETAATATRTLLAAPVINGYIPELQLNNSNTSSTSSYEYYMNTAMRLKNTHNQHQQYQHDLYLQKQQQQQLQMMLNKPKYQHIKESSENNNILLSKLDYYTLCLNRNKLLKTIDDETNNHLKVNLNIFFFY